MNTSIVRRVLCAGQGACALWRCGLVAFLGQSSLSGQNVRFVTSHDGARCGRLVSKMAETSVSYCCRRALVAVPGVHLSLVSIDSLSNPRAQLHASFPQKVTALTAAREPDIARSARQTACSKALGRAAQHIRRPTRAHPLHLRSTLLHRSHAHEMRHILPLRMPGRAAGGHVLADRAQKPSASTAGRLPVQCHVHNPPVCEAAASPVSRRCTAVPIGAEGAARSALKATSEVGTGGPATRIIETDVLPTSPSHEDACGSLGGL